MQLWGVINLTPDSFYPQSRFDSAAAISKAEEFLAHGATMVDIGAESTRPGAQAVDPKIQTERITAFISGIRKSLGETVLSRISIDTRHPLVMQSALDLGIRCINDVSGGSAEIYALIAKHSASYVLTHSQGTPDTMQKSPQYADVLKEVTEFLAGRSRELMACGVPAENILWDPGIGFGKKVDHNLTLIAHAPALRAHGYKLLMGVSRKSFIGQILQKDDPSDRLVGTLAVQVYLTLRGCDILRVHDVREMADCLKILSTVKQHEL